jgi:hypothetical protein
MAISKKQMQVQNAKNEVKNMIRQSGISAAQVIQLGQMAKETMQKRTMYPAFRNQVLATRLADSSDIPQNFNPSILGLFYTVGKLANDMQISGELGA